MISVGLFGETGGNPVRARRREAQQNTADLTGSHIPGQVIGLMSEKAGQKSAQSKYPDKPKSFCDSSESDCECQSLGGK